MSDNRGLRAEDVQGLVRRVAVSSKSVATHRGIRTGAYLGAAGAGGLMVAGQIPATWEGFAFAAAGGVAVAGAAAVTRFPSVQRLQKRITKRTKTEIGLL